MSFGFLETARGADVVARSPMERQARAAGARFEVRDGWNVAVSYPGESLDAVGFADASHTRKYELHGQLPALELGRATVDGDEHVAADDETRALILGGGRRPGRSRSRPASARCGSPARWRARRSRASPRSTSARRSRSRATGARAASRAPGGGSSARPRTAT